MTETAAAAAAAAAAALVSAEVQRSLGRIEGAIEAAARQSTDNLKRLDDLLTRHAEADKVDFQTIRHSIANFRQVSDAQFIEQTRARNQHLNEQDLKLDGLKQDADRAKGAGWIVLSLIGGLATLLGGTIIALINSWFGR